MNGDSYRLKQSKRRQHGTRPADTPARCYVGLLKGTPQRAGPPMDYRHKPSSWDISAEVH